jgi:Tol biopolymer transport system component
MTAKILFSISFFISGFTLNAQQRYLDQKPPGMVAEIFAPGLISTESLEHASPAFSPDGKTVLWSVMKLPSYQLYLKEMNFVNGQWTPAHSPSFSDTSTNEVYPCFSPDGNFLFFSSDRIENASTAKKNRLWYAKRTNDGWSKAQLLDSVRLEFGIYANSITKNWKRYFSAGPMGSMDWNIYASEAGGPPKRLPAHVNSPGYDDGPFIAPDESYLIFETDRQGTIGGSLDLYISFKKNNGDWTTPVNMGTAINTQGSERFAKVSPDGKYLFFGRNTGNGFDIYWISTNVIEGLKKQNDSAGKPD